MSSFSSADESAHYGASVGLLLDLYRDPLGWESGGVVEFGSGDAAAIAEVVRRLPALRIRGYDVSAPSVEEARENIAAHGVADRYTVELGDFFDQADAAGSPPVTTAIANPPYVPAPDDDIRMPELWGGVHGNDLVLRLLKAGYENVVVSLPSYSDPGTTVATALELGYRVVNFVAMGLDFGPYSSEPKVARHIRRLVEEGRGWADDRGYLVAATLFTTNPDLPGDRSGELLHALQL